MKTIWKWLSEWVAHHSGSFVGAGVVGGFLTLVGSVIATWGKAFKNNESVAKYLDQPAELVSPIILSLALVTCGALFVSRSRFKRIVDRFGIRWYSPHSNSSLRSADWKQIVTDLVRASSEKNQLCLLGASGEKTFGHSTSPLHEPLRSFEGTICVLLLCPNSEGFKQRVRGLSENEDSYRKEILDSIDYCQILATRYGRNIQVRVYSDSPIWKMIMTNRALWLWHYDRQTHVNESPLYGFAFSESEAGLLKGYKTVFERRWSHASTVTVNLKKWDRSKWNKILSGKP